MLDSKGPFSDRLQNWLISEPNRTLGHLQSSFGQKSFAIAFLLLMAIPALPLPTGGISHVLELVNMLLALELIIGLKTLWLPSKIRDMKLSDFMTKKALPKFITFIKKLEKLSRPRLVALVNSSIFLRFVGLFVLVYSLAAFLAPPFSGLDTLPSMGVVVIALSLILEDTSIFLGGVAIGLIGIIVELSLGSLVFKLL